MGVGMGVMSIGLVSAIQLTHAVVPPTPGPLAAAALVGADIGRTIIYGRPPRLPGRVPGRLGLGPIPGGAPPPDPSFRGVLGRSGLGGGRRGPSGNLVVLCAHRGAGGVDFEPERGPLPAGGGASGAPDSGVPGMARGGSFHRTWSWPGGTSGARKIESRPNPSGSRTDSEPPP